MLKIKGSEIRQEINALTRSAIGAYAMPFVSEELERGSNALPIVPDYARSVTGTYLNNRKLSIYGGSNEIQRSIISKTLLEL